MASRPSLIAGEMHFGRICQRISKLRVKQAKAMGLNALSFYLFWNLSEPQEGRFDFTGMNDVRRMCKICQDNGLWVILRPAPTAARKSTTAAFRIGPRIRKTPR